MKKKTILIFLAVFALLSGSAVLVHANDDWFVNGGSATIPRFFENIFAVGSAGTSPLSGDGIYALTGSGLQLLGSADPTGGGGLLYEGRSVPIAAEEICVGLKYYYSDSRDSSVPSAKLTNDSCSEFQFGFRNADGEFEVQGSAACGSVTVNAEGDRSIVIFDGDGDMPVFSCVSSGRTEYLIVHPVSEEPTVFNGNRYYGDFAFADLGNGKLTVVNRVELEHYVMGVCACEMSESWPVEALKAQAVAARTYAGKMLNSSVYRYSCGFDVTADNYCQAYLGYRGIGSHIERAVSETANEYLTCNDRLIDALYSASDGGATESNFNVFGSTGFTYLSGVIDPYEASAEENPYLAWELTMTPGELGKKVGLDAVETLTPTFSETGNVIKLEFRSVTGLNATIIRDSCRTVLGLKSIRYDISRDENGNFVFSGGGFGHNVGMSQWGAYAMAKYFEKDYRSILGFYYTGVGLSYGELQ